MAPNQPFPKPCRNVVWWWMLNCVAGDFSHPCANISFHFFFCNIFQSAFPPSLPLSLSLSLSLSRSLFRSQRTIHLFPQNGNERDAANNWNSILCSPRIAESLIKMRGLRKKARISGRSLFNGGRSLEKLPVSSRFMWRNSSWGPALTLRRRLLSLWDTI